MIRNSKTEKQKEREKSDPCPLVNKNELKQVRLKIYDEFMDN